MIKKHRSLKGSMLLATVFLAMAATTATANHNKVYHTSLGDDDMCSNEPVSRLWVIHRTKQWTIKKKVKIDRILSVRHKPTSDHENCHVTTILTGKAIKGSPLSAIKDGEFITLKLGCK